MEEISRSPVRLPPATTLLTFASLGGFWAVGSTLSVIIVSFAIGGNLPNSWPVLLLALVVAPIAGVPVGFLVGGGALVGLAVRPRVLAGALGAATSTLLASLPAWMATGMSPPYLIAVVVLAALAFGLTPLTLSVIRARPPQDRPATWLLVAGLACGIVSLAGVPLLLGSPLVLGAFGSVREVLIPVLSAAFAAVGFVLLAVGIVRTFFANGVLIAIVSVGTALGLALLATGQIVSVVSVATQEPDVASPYHYTPAPVPPESSHFSHDELGVAMQQLYDRTAAAAGSPSSLTVPVTDYCGSPDFRGHARHVPGGDRPPGRVRGGSPTVARRGLRHHREWKRGDRDRRRRAARRDAHPREHPRRPTTAHAERVRAARAINSCPCTRTSGPPAPSRRPRSSRYPRRPDSPGGPSTTWAKRSTTWSRGAASPP